jgi:hypothetical protein
MRKTTWLRLFIIALAATATLVALGCYPALAQCAMCKATASGLDAAATKQLDTAVVMMVSPPVAIFCAFIYLTYKHRRPPGGDD